MLALLLSANLFSAQLPDNPTANLRLVTANPTRIAYNPVRDFASAEIEYGLTRGDFHAVTASANAHQLRGDLYGLRHIGAWDMQGRFSYSNLQDHDQRWETRLWNEPANPYYVCDSVAGNTTTEAFHLSFTLAYTLSDRWKLGLDAALSTGERADQSDPRPGTSAMVIPVVVGSEWYNGASWHVGASGGIEAYSSTLAYYNVQPLNNHRYFVMKGMGDYLKRSTGDDSGYKRDYKRLTALGAVQAVWADATRHCSQVTEIAWRSGTEEATDGGSSYSFDGGSYAFRTVSLTDAWALRNGTSAQHSWTLKCAVGDGKGTWADQKRETDSEHASRVYYSTLSRSVNHKAQWLQAALSYQWEHLLDTRRDCFASAKIGMEAHRRTNYLGSS